MLLLLLSYGHDELLVPGDEAVERRQPGHGADPEPRLAGAGPQRGPVVAAELEAAVIVVEQIVLVVRVLVAEVGHGHEQERRHHPARQPHGLPGPDVTDHHALGRHHGPELLPPRRHRRQQAARLLGDLGLGLGGGEVVPQLLVRVPWLELLEHEVVPGDDAEEVDEALGVGADDAPHLGAAGVGLEDGEVDVGVGVGGVEEAAARHGVGRAPQAEDPVHVLQVRQERAVLVVALAGARRAQHRHQGWQLRVLRRTQLATEEGTSGVKQGRHGLPLRLSVLRLLRVLLPAGVVGAAVHHLGLGGGGHGGWIDDETPSRGCLDGCWQSVSDQCAAAQLNDDGDIGRRRSLLDTLSWRHVLSSQIVITTYHAYPAGWLPIPRVDALLLSSTYVFVRNVPPCR